MPEAMLTRDEILHRVQGVLCEALKVDRDVVTLEANIQEDLDADSLDVVELLMECEDQLGIKIPDTAAQKMKTVGDVVDFAFHRQSDPTYGDVVAG